MKYLLGTIWASLLAISLYLYLSPPKLHDGVASIGKVAELSGTVFYRDPFQTVWLEASKGQTFQAGTTLSTGTESSAKLIFANNYTVEVPEDSEISLEVPELGTEEFSVNIVSGGAKVSKDTKNELSFIEQAKNKYKAAILSSAPVNIITGGNKYQLDTQVKTAKFTKSSQAVEISFVEGSILNKGTNKSIEPGTRNVNIQSIDSLSEPSISSKSNKSDPQNLNLNDGTNVKDMEFLSAQLKSIVLAYEDADLEFVRSFERIDEESGGKLLLRFKSNSAPLPEFEYRLIVKVLGKSPLTLNPKGLSENDLTFELTDSFIDEVFSKNSNLSKIDYFITAGINSSSKEEDSIFKGQLKFFNPSTILAFPSTIHLYYRPSHDPTSQWLPRFGRHIEKPQHSLTFYKRDGLLELLRTIDKNFAFDIQGPVTEDRNKYFAIRNRAIWYSTENIKSMNILKSMKGNLDLIYSGTTNSFIKAEDSEKFNKLENPSEFNMTFVNSLLNFKFDGFLSQKQLSSLLDKLDEDFLINGKVEFSKANAARISKVELPLDSVRKPKIIIFKRSQSGILETNPKEFEFFNAYFQPVSKDLVNSNFTVNLIDLETISKKPDHEKRIITFVSQLKIANVLGFANETNQGTSLRLIWNENGRSIEKIITSFKPEETVSQLSKTIGYNCTARILNDGRAFISFPTSENSHRNFYIWKDTSQLNILSNAFLSSETPLLAICMEADKTGCFAKVFPSFTSKGTLKCTISTKR